MRESPPVELSLLELGHAGVADGAAAVLRSVLATARFVDTAGLRRMWFPEHHSGEVVAPAPDLMCALVASSVSRVRLGAAGVLLRLHSPWAVAERWAMLSHIAPGGLDLGIARAGADHHRAAALLADAAAGMPSEFEGRVAALVSHLSGLVGPRLHPEPAPGVEIWLHGRHYHSADVARRFGLRYCHARFLGEPTPGAPESNAVAVAGVCASNDGDAKAWASPALGAFRPTLLADQQRWARELLSLHDVEGVSEVVFVDMCRTPTDHLRSVALLAEVANSVP